MADDPDRRSRLLDVATALFEARGFAAVGVDRITSAAGVGAMALYRNVGSKDQLIAAVLERWCSQWQQRLVDQLAARPGTVPQRLLQLFDVLADWFTAEDFHGSLASNAAVELRGNPDHPAQPVIAAHRAWLHRFLEQLAADAGVPDPPAAAEQLHLLVEGTIARALVGEGAAAAAGAQTLAARLLPPPDQ